MRIHQYIHMYLQRYVRRGFAGKIRISVSLGLLLLGATVLAHILGTSAYTHAPYSDSKHTSSVNEPIQSGKTSIHSRNKHTSSVNEPIQSGKTSIHSGSKSIYSVVDDHMPAPQSSSSSDIVAMIQQVFGSYGAGAVRVARCESGLNPNAHNPGGPAGLFQIMPGTWAGTAQAGQSRYNAAANIAAAHQIFVRDGYSWREWTCKP